jgi:3-oxoacyl-[acyl-carrier-protein] synthase III
MVVTAGMVSTGGYLPAKEIKDKRIAGLVEYLARETLLPREYTEQIEESGQLPGTIGTNSDGWEEQPWFEVKSPPQPLR